MIYAVFNLISNVRIYYMQVGHFEPVMECRISYSESRQSRTNPKIRIQDGCTVHRQ